MHPFKEQQAAPALLILRSELFGAFWTESSLPLQLQDLVKENLSLGIRCSECLIPPGWGGIASGCCVTLWGIDLVPEVKA